MYNSKETLLFVLASIILINALLEVTFVFCMYWVYNLFTGKPITMSSDISGFLEWWYSVFLPNKV